MRSTLINTLHAAGAGVLLAAAAPAAPASLAAASLVADGASIQAWLALVLAAGNTAAALGFGYHRARRANGDPPEQEAHNGDQAVQGDARADDR